MSKLRNVVNNTSDYKKSVADIAGVIAHSGGMINNAGLAGQVIALESLQGDDLVRVQGTYGEMRNQLLATPSFSEMLDRECGDNADRKEIALEAAIMTMMAVGDLNGYFAASTKSVDMTGDAVVVNPSQGMLDYAPATSNKFALEGFDPASLNQFLPQSVFANAMAAIQGSFEETWFPIQIVPAGQSGVEVNVQIPKIFSAVQRNLNGTISNFNKTSMIRALVKSDLLESNSTKIVPVAANDQAGPDNVLALAAVVANVGVTLDGTVVQSRPILFGKKVDLLGISTTAAMLAGGILNETDALDSVLNVGKLYVTATLNGVSLNVAVDVSRQIGALLQKAAEGSDTRYTTTFTAQVALERDSLVSVNGGSVPALEAEFDIAGINKLVGEIKISAEANTEEGYMEVYANGAKWTAAYNVDGDIVAFPGGANTVTPIAYMPLARRTNSNLRLRGTIIDSNVSVNYRFAVPLASPFISQSPIGGVANTTIEGLAHAERIRNNGNAVKAILALEEILAAGAGLPVNSPLMGAEMVFPAYAQEDLDLEGVVVRMASKDSLHDLRGAFTAAVMTIVDRLLQESEYLAALEFETGSNNAYEVIVVTDSRIYPWLMESGDSRTLGNNRQYKITQCLNENIENKIYVSFRRANRDGQLHPLDFGGFLYTPALTHQVQVTRAGSVVQEIHTIPRNAHYVTLPVLGRIDVTNMVELFVESV